MPVFNCSSYIKIQIESILEQTFSNFELIVVDDGSTDNTVDIVNAFVKIDSRVNLYHNEYSKGISGALNTAIKYATGDYIARSDGDDVCILNRFELQYNFLEDNKEISIVGTFSTLFNQYSEIRNTKYPVNPLELCWYFISNSYFCHPSVMFRKNLIERFGTYPYVISEDFAFFSKIIKHVQGSNIPLCLVKYRVHPTSYSFTIPEAIKSYVSYLAGDNYRYYIASGEYQDEFIQFQSQKRLPLLMVFKILRVNAKIIKKIRNNYSISIFSYYYFNFILSQFGLFVQSIFNQIRFYHVNNFMIRLKNYLFAF